MARSGSRSRSPLREGSDVEHAAGETVRMSELWDLFVNDMKVVETEAVVTNAIDKFGEYGITSVVQLEDADDELVKLIFPSQPSLRRTSWLNAPSGT